MGILGAGKCAECGKNIIVLDTERGSALPVEHVPGKHYAEDEMYNKENHRSHLLDCNALAQRWESVKNRLIKRRNAKYKLEQKDLLR